MEKGYDIWFATSNERLEIVRRDISMPLVHDLAEFVPAGLDGAEDMSFQIVANRFSDGPICLQRTKT